MVALNDEQTRRLAEIKLRCAYPRPTPHLRLLTDVKGIARLQQLWRGGLPRRQVWLDVPVERVVKLPQEIDLRSLERMALSQE